MLHSQMMGWMELDGGVFSCSSCPWKPVMWCFEDNAKREPSDILVTSTWCEQAWDGNRLVPLIRRWLFFANQTVDLLRPTWDCECFLMECSSPASWLPLTWSGGLTLLPRALSSSHRLQYNPSTMQPPSETDMSRTKQRGAVWAFSRVGAQLRYTPPVEGEHVSGLSVLPTSAVLGSCPVHSSKKKIPEMIHVIAPSHSLSCPPHHSYLLPPLTLIAARTLKVGHWL